LRLDHACGSPADQRFSLDHVSLFLIAILIRSLLLAVIAWCHDSLSSRRLREHQITMIIVPSVSGE
ncbi:hypothetical protein, partial [Vibrio alginolyticus]|uniref:hypothetical protein n=1 Tax=Vibrio alginolyticus TaxID=663 RepID=UPI001EEB1008